MGLKYKTIKDDLYKLDKGIDSIKNKKINCGVLGDGEQAWLAGIHEYGCRIVVTPKMRKYLHRQGLHLKATTNVIVIPERSFIRSGWDNCHLDVLNKTEKLIGNALHGEMTEVAFFDMVGGMLSTKMKTYARNLAKPPKHPFTIAQNPNKRNPLIVTGSMVNSITYEVE